jgi:hypothetical protein
VIHDAECLTVCMHTGAHGTSHQNRLVCLSIILGVTSRELRELNLSENVTVSARTSDIIAAHTPPFDSQVTDKLMTNSERFYAIHDWLHAFASKQLQVDMPASGTIADSRGGKKKPNKHLQSLLMDAYNAYKICKTACRYSTSSTWCDILNNLT